MKIWESNSFKKQVEKLQKTINKNIKKNFNETPKLNSYFF